MASLKPATNYQNVVIDQLLNYFDNPIVTRQNILEACKYLGCATPYFILSNPEYLYGTSSATGEQFFNLKANKIVVEGHTEVAPDPAIDYRELVETRSGALVEGSSPMSSLVPEIDINYQPFGFFTSLVKIIETKEFFPVFIAGDSGYGKTTMVEQVCALTKRELIRVQISKETDKASLLVVPTLVNGNLTYENGPVLDAMERGAVLLLDEIDRGTANMICLQSIMEGKPYYNEKKQQVIHAAPGFTVIATANSKGQGDSIKYLVNILDAAFLERFVITVIQKAPNEVTETKILNTFFDSHNENQDVFVKHLVRWANHTRLSEEQGTIDESISTRRLIYVCKTYLIFGNRLKAIELCVARFDDNIRKSFVDFYTKIDAEANKPVAPPTASKDIWEEEVKF